MCKTRFSFDKKVERGGKEEWSVELEGRSGKFAFCIFLFLSFSWKRSFVFGDERGKRKARVEKKGSALPSYLEQRPWLPEDAQTHRVLSN